MKILLDAKVIGEIARPDSLYRDNLLSRFNNNSNADFFISTLTLVECRARLEALKRSRKISKEVKAELVERVEKQLSVFQLVPFDDLAALKTVEVEACSLKQGRELGFVDMCLAGQAIALGAVLVSHDKKAYEGLLVPGFVWEVWFV